MTHAIIDYHGNTVDIPRQKDVKRKLNREMIWDLIRRRKSLVFIRYLITQASEVLQIKTKMWIDKSKVEKSVIIVTKNGSKDILYYRSLPTLKFQLWVKFEESVRAEAMLTEKDNFIIYNDHEHIGCRYTLYK